MNLLWWGLTGLLAAVAGFDGGAPGGNPKGAKPLILHTRHREPVPALNGEFAAREKEEHWDPGRSALIICDMWDQHWCKGATRRVVELAPAIDRAVKAARERGVLIIHAPSSCMEAYKDHPARKRAQAAPKAANLPGDIDGWCRRIPAEESGTYPIDQEDGGCDDGPRCPGGSPWRSQIAAIEIRDEDAISDSGVEIWNLLESRGIDRVFLVGVHTNMCVLGRPFGLRQLARHGKHVVLVRDLTDTMYNSRSWPYVSHFEGTSRIVEHIEKHVSPTILSTDLTGQPEFRFRPETPRRPRAVFLIGDDEYRTEKTLPAFAERELEPLGIRCTLAIADPKTPHDFPGAEALRDADLLLVSVRRRAPTEAQMKLIRDHVASGKPVVGIRTASHAFDTRGKAPAGHAEWPGFAPEVLGGHYTGHHDNDLKPRVTLARGAEGHPVLEGVTTAPITGRGRSTRPARWPPRPGPAVGEVSAIPPSRSPGSTSWGRRGVFYTSLGHPGDFENPSFRRLLRNAVFWALNRQPSWARRTNPLASAEPTAPPASSSRRPLAPRGGPSAAPRPGRPEARPRPERTCGPAAGEPELRRRGRLWVVQYLQYPFPAGLRMLSRDGVWRAVYDRVPPPPPHHFRGRDKITIHEDSDGDGRFDRHKTFVDGLNIATSVLRGRGGVWVLNPPYLLFYPDRDGNDVPDGDPEVHLQGFGLEDTHSVVNSLRWGPDGWIYAAQGSTVTGHVTRPGLDDGKEPVHTMGQLIWRYHPETRRYEVFAEGGGNAFGVEIDSRGRIFSGHNGSGDTRGFHYVQGYYQKGFDKHGPLSNPYAFGYFPAMKHNRVPRFTHTFVIDEGGAFPDRYRGVLFGVAPLLNHVVTSAVEPDGSSVRTRDIGHAVTSDDPWFRPVDITLGPDGALYIADWYDRQVNHYRNHEGQIDPGSGRIYRLAANGQRPSRMPDLSVLSSSELLDRLQSPNRTIRQTALRMIADRKDRSLVPRLEQRLRDREASNALESLWALNLVAGLDDSTAMAMLHHADPDVRLWTVRLACDRGQVSPALAARLARLASLETSVEVRSQLACSARRLPTKDSLPILAALLARQEDARDIHIPLLLWWAVEAKVGTDPDAVLRLFEDRVFWDLPTVSGTIAERLMRRFAAAGSRKDLERCARLISLAPREAHTRILLSGFEAAFAGRSLSGIPDTLAEALAKYSGESLTIGLRQGKPAAVAEALEILRNEQGDRSKQLRLLQLLGEVRVPGAVAVLLPIACGSPDNALRAAALGALANYDDPSIPAAVLRPLPDLSEDLLAAAQGLLVSRKPSALLLLEAIDARQVEARTIPREIAERFLLYKDARIKEMVARHFSTLKPSTPAELQSQIVRLAGVVRSGPGVPKPGRQLFLDQCSRCHTLFGKGGKVGPDLTTYRRDDLETMLLNIVNPSAEVREGYGCQVVATADGRTLTGILVEQDRNVVVLRGSDGKDLTLSRSTIEEISPSRSSIMPEGLLKDLTEQQVRDLFAYLRSTQPLID
ncbi:MAG: PVC-type heme-binding CxxCH protein [Isosphaeraceae bacterium]